MKIKKVLQFIVLTGLAVVILLALISWIVIKTVDVDGIRNKVAGELSIRLDRDVGIEHAGFRMSLDGGIQLSLRGLSVGEDPAFGTAPFMTLQGAYLDVDLGRLIRERELFVTRLELLSPEIRLLRDSEGVLNIASLRPLRGGGEDLPQPAPQRSGDPESSAEPAGPAEIPKSDKTGSYADRVEIESVRIENGVFSYRDSSEERGALIPLKHIEMLFSSVAMDRFFPFELSFALWNDRTNYSAAGNLRLDTRTGTVTVSDTSGQMELADVSWNRVEDDVPAIASLSIAGQPAGRVRHDIRELVLGPSGVVKAEAAVELEKGRFASVYLRDPLEDVSCLARVTRETIEGPDCSLVLSGGRLRVSGSVAKPFADPRLELTADLRDLDLGKLIAKEFLPAEVEGWIQGETRLSAGSSPAGTPEIRGDLKIQVDKGRLLDINVWDVVSEKLNELSVFAGTDLMASLEKRVSEDVREILNKNDTEFERVSLSAILSPDVIRVSEWLASTKELRFVAAGTLDWEGTAEIYPEVYIEKAMAAELIEMRPELSGLLTTGGSAIKIPMTPYHGPARSFRTVPNLADIARDILIDQGKEKLRDVLFKAIDLDKDYQRPPENENQDQDIPGFEDQVQDLLDLF